MIRRSVYSLQQKLVPYMLKEDKAIMEAYN